MRWESAWRQEGNLQILFRGLRLLIPSLSLVSQHKHLDIRLCGREGGGGPPFCISLLFSDRSTSRSAEAGRLPRSRAVQRMCAPRMAWWICPLSLSPVSAPGTASQEQSQPRAAHNSPDGARYSGPVQSESISAEPRPA